MCLCCKLKMFPFSEQSNSDISLTNPGFNNSFFPKATKIFLDENINSFFTECNSIETPFNNSDYPVLYWLWCNMIVSTVILTISISSVLLLQLYILILRRYRNILMIHKIFYSFWNILLILLKFRNLKLTKIQWILFYSILLF